MINDVIPQVYTKENSYVKFSVSANKKITVIENRNADITQILPLIPKTLNLEKLLKAKELAIANFKLVINFLQPINFLNVKITPDIYWERIIVPVNESVNYFPNKNYVLIKLFTLDLEEGIYTIEFI